MSHTPGPWVVDGLAPPPGKRKRNQSPSLLMVVAEAGGMPGVLVNQGPIEPRDIANAHLIAAAPDLLAACKAVLQPTLSPEHDALVRAAIAKAEGK